MNTLKLFALSLVACFTMSAQAVETFQLQANSNSEVVQPLATQYHSYYFGINWIHFRQVVRFNVQNTGTEPLTGARATISGHGYNAVHSCTGVVMPGQRCWFEISYWPLFEGVHYGRFILSFVENSNIVVDVWGEARRF